MQIFKLLRNTVNAYLAGIIYILYKRKKQNSRTVWLIGGHNGNLYTDNAKVFYEYMIERHPEIDIYWVVNRNAPVYHQIKGKKTIKGSIGSYLLFYRSRVSLFSDTFNSDIVPMLYVLPLLRNFYFKNFKVYLNHGNIAFKKRPKSPWWAKKFKDSVFKSYNMATASTALEKQIMESYIDPSAVVLTGSARNDHLTAIASETESILVVPTWRNWLYRNKHIDNTDFFNAYAALLFSEKLRRYLQEKNIILYFYLHHMFQKFLPEFSSFDREYIKVLDPGTDMGMLIKKADLMVTDYSSICSDFYYLRKPVIFFQFDKDRYLEEVGSYIDIDSVPFGDVVYSADKLIEKIIASIEDGYKVSELQKKGEKYFVNFMDRNNCQRIFNTIQEKMDNNEN